MSDSGLAIQTMEQAQGLAKTLAPSALLPDTLRGKPGDVLIVLLTGAELGLGPMTALRSLSVVKGKAVMSADLMLALVKKSPACEYLTMSEYTPERVTFKTKRKGDPAETVVTFAKSDAERAGLWGNNTWKSYPQAMLKARAASTICRSVYPDVCLGIYDETEAVADFKVPPAALPAVAPALPPPTDAIQVKAEALLERVEASQGPSIPILDHDPDTGEVLEEPAEDEDVTADMSEEDYWKAKVTGAKTRAAALGEMSKAPVNLKSALSAVYNQRWAARAQR